MTPKQKLADTNKQLKQLENQRKSILDEQNKLEKEIKELEFSKMFTSFKPSARSMKFLLDEANKNNPNIKKSSWFKGLTNVDEYISIPNWTITNIEREHSEDNDSCHIILRVDEEGVLHSHWKVPGYYSSYDDDCWDWNYMAKVQPKEVTITRWEGVE